jgi:hypothetical protein
VGVLRTAKRGKVSDILDRLDAAGKTPYPSVLVVRDAAAEIRRLRSYWTGDKLTGGHDVCWTCAAHCVVIGDLETERDALAAELLRVRGWQVSFLENWEAAELRAVKAENRIIALEAALRKLKNEVGGVLI